MESITQKNKTSICNEDDEQVKDHQQKVSSFSYELTKASSKT
jgi:hypothetical protein